MSISDRLDQIEEDIPLAARSPEMAQHFTADHGPQLVAAVRAVLDLHKPDAFSDPSICGHCSVVPTEDEIDFFEATAIYVDYPCPTIRAIATALGEDTP